MIVYDEAGVAVNHVAYVYALLDSRSMEIRYIGGTVSPLEVRLNDHFCLAAGEAKARWLRRLKAQRRPAKITVVERLVGRNKTKLESDLRVRERHWILAFEAAGFRLFNKNLPLGRKAK